MILRRSADLGWWEAHDFGWRTHQWRADSSVSSGRNGVNLMAPRQNLQSAHHRARWLYDPQEGGSTQVGNGDDGA